VAALDAFVEQALRRGPLAPGTFRVVVLEADARFTIRDFASLAEAQTYANDAASETDGASPIAKVCDEHGLVVHEGVSFVSGGQSGR
jgi:hypothetical protein